jgi:hypothetical protein
MDDHGGLHLVTSGYYAKLQNMNDMGNYLCMSEKTWQNYAKLKKTCGIKIAGCDPQCSRIG